MKVEGFFDKDGEYVQKQTHEERMDEVDEASAAAWIILFLIILACIGVILIIQPGTIRKGVGRDFTVRGNHYRGFTRN